MILPLVALATLASTPHVVVIDPLVVRVQRWEGFGCSLSWWGVFTETWPEKARKEVCRLLFGRGEDCLGWSIVRYNAGGTAPAADARRFRPGGKVQVTLDADGSFHPHRDTGQIACLREAKRLGADVFELFANTPPHWMLRNGDTHGGDGGDENLRPECEAEYARWLVDLASKLERSAGVRFASIEPFNEPSAGWWRADKDGQEGCRFLPPAQARVLRALRTEIEARRARWMVACSDENEPHTALNTVVSITNPSEGGLSPSIIGRLNVHGYWGWEWQERLRAKCDELGISRIWMSEYSGREWENAGYVPNDMRCALPQTRAALNDIRRLRPNAWIFWQAVEPLQFCLWYHFTYGLLQAAADAPVDYNGVIDKPGMFVVSKAFWAMMQLSRFIRPGYRIVETDDRWTLAALAPGGKRLAIVVHHDEKTPRRLTLDLTRFAARPSRLRAWRTMDDADGIQWNCRALPAPTVRAGYLAADIPARSVTTYIIDRR